MRPPRFPVMLAAQRGGYLMSTSNRDWQFTLELIEDIVALFDRLGLRHHVGPDGGLVPRPVRWKHAAKAIHQPVPPRRGELAQVLGRFLDAQGAAASDLHLHLFGARIAVDGAGFLAHLAEFLDATTGYSEILLAGDGVEWQVRLTNRWVYAVAAPAAPDPPPGFAAWPPPGDRLPPVGDGSRRRLQERRRLLALRRHRQGISARFRAVSPFLCAAGCRISKLMPPGIDRVLGPLAAGPGRDEELLFDWMPGSAVDRWETKAERDALFRSALAACAAPSDRVAAIWSSHEAGLVLDAGALGEQAALVLDTGHGSAAWIAAARGGPWLIQVASWSRTVAYCRSVPVRTDSLHRRYPPAG